MSPTDWIEQLQHQQEKERRRVEASVERDRALRASQRESFERVKEQVCPVLERIVRELSDKTGITLSISVAETAILVRAPRTDQVLPRIDTHRFVISNPGEDSSTVRVVAIEDLRIDRGDPPDHMSMSEWSGEQRDVVDVRTSVSELVRRDIDLLVQWLARTALDDKSPGIPRISGQLKEEKAVRRRKRAKAKASWALACSIGGLLFSPILLPLAVLGLWLGFQARGILGRVGDRRARTKAAWAIGLGILGFLAGIAAAAVYLNQGLRG